MRIVLTGPESVGKTTLAERLAQITGRSWVPEFARGYLEDRHGQIEAGDMPVIFWGQWELEQRALKDAILDTDVRMTVVWWERLFPPCPVFFKEQLSQLEPRKTFLLAPDVPWVADPVRYLPHEGEEFFSACQRLFNALGHPYHVLSGNWQQREQLALAVMASNDEHDERRI